MLYLTAAPRPIGPGEWALCVNCSCTGFSEVRGYGDAWIICACCGLEVSMSIPASATTKPTESGNGQAEKEKETVRYEVHPERSALLLCCCLVTTPLLLTKLFSEFSCPLIQNSSHYPYILGYSLQFNFWQGGNLDVAFQRLKGFPQVQ